MKRAHQETMVFSLISLIGNLLPLCLGLLFYWANLDKWTGWSTFYKDGQFYLYSASLLTSSAYIFYTYKSKNTDRYSLMFLLSCLLVLLVSIFYAFKLAKNNNNEEFILYSSIVVFCITVVLFYYSNYLNNKQIIDVGETRREGVKDIMDKL